MTAPHLPVRGPRRLRFVVEPLENRSLLSGFEFALSPNSAAESDTVHRIPLSNAAGFESGSSGVAYGAVQVVEVKLADGEMEDESPVAIEQLPSAVVAAILNRFPGARLIAAEMDNDDDGRHFDVSAELSGAEFSITLTFDGEVTEVDQILRSADVPKPVLDWIEFNYPGASIREAEISSAGADLSYEISFATISQRELDATLRLATSAPFSTRSAIDLDNSTVFLPSASLLAPPSSQTTTVDHGSQSLPALMTSIVTGPLFDSLRQAAESIRPRSTHEPSRDPARTVGPADCSSTDHELLIAKETTKLNPKDSIDSSRAMEAGDLASTGLAMLPATVSLLTQAAPAIWVPQFAAALDNVLSLDLGAMEQGLREFLDEIDALAEQLVPSIASGRLTSGILFTALVLTGTERLLSEIKKRKQDPVLSSAQGNSTWTWVMGLSTLTHSKEQ